MTLPKDSRTPASPSSLSIKRETLWLPGYLGKSPNWSSGRNFYVLKKLRTEAQAALRSSSPVVPAALLTGTTSTRQLRRLSMLYATLAESMETERQTSSSSASSEK